MDCDLSYCDAPAAALIHFIGKDAPVPYCEDHAFNRWGRLVFGRMNKGVWVSPVRHVQLISQPQGAHDE